MNWRSEEKLVKRRHHKPSRLAQMLGCSAIATLGLKVVTFRRVVVLVGYPILARILLFLLQRLQPYACRRRWVRNQQMESL